MKKLLSIVLAISMVATLFVFGIPANAVEVGGVESGYAPEGTAINTADDFAGMSADGKYYLNADITIDATWNGGAALSATYASNTAFTGTLDGNGHKITTTAPLFANLAGTVKNLTIEGEVAAPVVGDATLYNAALAIYAKGTVVIDNVLSKANVLFSEYSAGIVAFSQETAVNLTIKNCVNEGNIAAGSKAGSMIAYANVGTKTGSTHEVTVTIENCVNKGDITATGSINADPTYIGGIAGRLGRDYGHADNIKSYVKNCVNYGTVKGQNGKDNDHAAGIVGFMAGYLEISGCTNNGLIENNTTEISFAAGILSGASSRAEYCGFLIDHCVNNGDIKAAAKAVGIAGQFTGTNASGYTYIVSNCANNGKIYGTACEGQTEALYVCGITGQMKGSVNTKVFNCINTGDLFVDPSKMASGKSSLVSGIFAYTASANVMAKNCISIGNITVTGGTVTRKTTLFYYASATALANVTNNYAVAVEGANNILTTSADTTDQTKNFTTVTADEVASGAVVYALNEAAGETIYYQDLATGKITLKAAEDGSNLVIKNADGTYSNPAPVTGPQAIKNADDFAAMLPNGEYYLDADITLAASYVGTFTGILDGKNHTITTTAPLFTNLAGTVKNLTVDGEIAASTDNAANIAVTTSGNVTFENIVTNADILGATRAGALIADTPGNSTTITIKNCVNNADITADQHAGGFVGRIDGITNFYAENCTNNGDITSTALYAAGIITIVGNDNLTEAQAQTMTCTIKNCTNTGDISGKEKNSSGIVGYSLGVITIENCVNHGDVENEKENAAGILGSSAYQAYKAAIYITGCENHGEIKAAKIAGGISAFFARNNPIAGMTHSIESCANYGDIYLYTSGANTDSYGSQVAGIAARSYASKTGSNPYEIKNCINFGDITVDMENAPATPNVAGIIAYSNQAKHLFENNINLGNITVVNGETNYEASTIVLRATSPDSTCIKNNYGITITGVEIAGASASGFTFTDAMVKEVTEEQVESGELVYTLNAAAGKTIFYQDLANDGLPTLKANDAHIVNKTGDVYHNGDAPQLPDDTEPDDDTTTTPPDDTNTPPVNPPSPPTSDSGVTAIIIATIAILSVAFTVAFVVIKKKEN